MESDCAVLYRTLYCSSCSPETWKIITVLLFLHIKSVIRDWVFLFLWQHHTHGPQGLTPLSVPPQSLDLAEYNVLFVLSFTTPAFDSDVAPSFGTLLATVNVALNMLGEVLALFVSGSTTVIPECSGILIP